jgi:5-methylcytosine-specific restriction endonuclease McrA
MQVLVLSPHYTPHRVCSWQDAITEFFTDKVEIVESYDEVIHHAGMRMPAVVRLLKPIARMKKGVKFSRVNIYSRDHFSCCYCGFKGTMKELNYDHVIPRHQGGKTDWGNIVTCCYPCNARKRNRTPEQAGMRLLNAPHKPKTLPLAQPVLSMREIPEKWRPYLV